ncbi:chorismate mutase [uncultured Treponema sp.]|uniref:chorismate mutase n=1 Tax=uncultured Treponema sp. TaxID=162155 RepID=UPI000E9ECF39|nr:chorismate mutase [uncultured Treponema sp.]HAZ97323.1 chorismate mutase [Treponema sp.]
MEKRIFGIRGAVCAENTPESIKENVGEMCHLIFKENNLQPDDIVSVHFTMTQDLKCMNAAAALRKSDVGIDTSLLALFVSQEASIDGMLPRAIRVLVTAYLPAEKNPVHVYINGAEKLRPDFSKGK